MKSFVWHGLIAFIVVFLGPACNDEPIGPAPVVYRSIKPAEVQSAQIPEEEILGTVFSNLQVTPSAVKDWSVQLTEVDNGACIFALNADGSRGSCLGSQVMPVMPNGSRPPKQTAIMWGWFDDLDTDNNPCNPQQRATGTPIHERHDLNLNGVADDSLDSSGNFRPEQHCVTTGRYRVALSQKLTAGIVPADNRTFTRTVDHERIVRVDFGGTLRSVENASGAVAHDTFVHFDIGTSFFARWSVMNNSLAIDNPETSVAFAKGDSVTRVGVPMRFDSKATPFPARTGALMYRVYFDADVDETIRSGYWNPGEVIRTRAFEQARLFATQAEVVEPKDRTDRGSLSPKRVVDVQPATTTTVASVAVTPASASIPVGGSVTLSATPRDASGHTVPDKVVTWSTSNPSVASIAPSSNSVTVTGQSQGTATITASVDGVSGTATVTVTVSDPGSGQVATVEVSPLKAQIEVGQSTTFTATPRDASGHPISDRIVTWSTSSSAVASISPSGNTVTVTGKGTGSATIRAQVDDVFGTATVDVTPGSVGSVEVLPSSISIQVGQTAVPAARVTASDGTVLNDRAVTWSTSDAAVASIEPVESNTVIVTGQSVGTATVTATVEGKSGSTAVSVTPPVDQATAAGNTFPGGMLSGGIASVDLWMRNSGTTTWSAGDGYQLDLVRDLAEWLPTSVGVPGSVGPQATASFFFDLRHIQPGTTGSVPAFFRMARQGVRFGDENGADVLLSSDGCIVCLGIEAETTTLAEDPTTTWLVGAVDAGTTPLALDGAALRSQGAAQVGYAFAHGAPRRLDIVLRFTYDPAVLRPARSQVGPGGAALERTAGLRGAGTYWVRLTGTVPAGRGRIIAFPFQLVEGAEPSGELGTLTIFYPPR